jgi:hypothetical protein
MVVVGNSVSAIGGAMFTGCVACSPRNARSRGVPWRVNALRFTEDC